MFGWPLPLRAHLEPEILIVDEVLAVGDAEFQKKCLGKMDDVANQKAAPFFLSVTIWHAVQALCTTGLVLQNGCTKYRGPVEQALQEYSASIKVASAVTFTPDNSRPSITHVAINQAQLDSGNLQLDIGFKSPFCLSPPVVGVVVYSSLGVPVFGSNPRFHRDGYGSPKLQQGIVRFTTSNLPIHGGTYRLSIWLGDWQEDYDEQRDVLAFHFRRGQRAPNTPSPDMIGYLDAGGYWSVISHTLDHL